MPLCRQDKRDYWIWLQYELLNHYKTLKEILATGYDEADERMSMAE